MFEHWLNSFVPTLQHLGPYAYLAVFLVFLLEAIVGIGLIVPGAIVAFLLGTLISRGGFQFPELLLAGTLGFLIGDIISFYLGRKGTSFFTHDARILKLSLLEKGKTFFEQHGSKSVFLGRFIGFVRPLTPFIAGLAKMTWIRFLLLNLASIITWLYLHLLAGYFFGQALWLIRLWSGRLETLMIYAVTGTALLWLSKRLIIKNGRALTIIIGSIWRSFIDALERNQKLKRFRIRHDKIFAFLGARFARDTFWGLGFSIISLLWTYTVLNFIWLTDNLFTDGTIAELDQRIENLMHTFKNFYFMKFFVGLSVFGSWQMILVFGLSLLLWFYVSGRLRLAWALLLSIAGSGLTTYFLKMLITRPRPHDTLYLETSSSFPSLHATLALAFYGFLFFIYYRAQENYKKKINVLFLLSVFIGFIGLSRLYLRAHFLSDVIAGYLIGFSWLLIAIGFILYFKLDRIIKPQPRTLRLKFIAAYVILIEVIAYVSLFGYYRSQLNLRKLEPPTETVSQDILADFKNYGLDQYSESFDGDPQEPISMIITASSSTQIIDSFKQIGYNRADKPNFSALLTLFKRGLLNEPYPSLPISPSFWETNVDDLSFTKQLNNERHYAVFWDTSFKTPNGKTIYAGMAGAKRPTRLIIKKKMNPNIDGERELIFERLKNENLIASWSRHQFIEPQIVKKLMDEYFTDGKLYIIDLK